MGLCIFENVADYVGSAELVDGRECLLAGNVGENRDLLEAGGSPCLQWRPGPGPWASGVHARHPSFALKTTEEVHGDVFSLPSVRLLFLRVP